MYDLIEILQEANLSPPEIIELLNKVDKDEIQDYALSNGICPRCGCEVVIHIWKEERGEYQGVPAYEEMSEWLCESCKAVY